MSTIQHDVMASDDTSVRCHIYASQGNQLIGYTLDGTATAFTPQTSVALPAVVQAGARHSSLNRLYIASSNGGYAANFAASDEHFLSAFDIDPAGALTPLGETVSLANRPVDITIDEANTHLLVAYSDPAGISVHPIRNDGSIAADFDEPMLELHAYSHQIMVSPEDDFITVCCTGQLIDRTADPAQFRGGIHVFRYEDGRVGDELRSASPNGGLQFSPRDLEFHPTLPLAYVSLERQHELHVFGYDSTGIESVPRYRESTLIGAPSKAMQFTGTVRMHPSGRFMYVANRTLGAYNADGKKLFGTGGDNIAVFEIDLESGRPTLIQNIDSEGIMPRTMATDPAGKLLVVANQFEVEAFDGENLKTVPQSLVLYRIASDGFLTRIGKRELEPGTAPMIWMDVVPDARERGHSQLNDS